MAAPKVDKIILPSEAILVGAKALEAFGNIVPRRYRRAVAATVLSAVIDAGYVEHRGGGETTDDL
jgi:hypothetical protein